MWILQKHDVRVWTGFSWLKMVAGSVDYCCENCNVSSGGNDLTCVVRFSFSAWILFSGIQGRNSFIAKYVFVKHALFAHSVSSKKRQRTVVNLIFECVWACK